MWGLDALDKRMTSLIMIGFFLLLPISTLIQPIVASSDSNVEQEPVYDPVPLLFLLKETLYLATLGEEKNLTVLLDEAVNVSVEDKTVNLLHEEFYTSLRNLSTLLSFMEENRTEMSEEEIFGILHLRDHLLELLNSYYDRLLRDVSSKGTRFLVEKQLEPVISGFKEYLETLDYMIPGTLPSKVSLEVPYEVQGCRGGIAVKLLSLGFPVSNHSRVSVFLVVMGKVVEEINTSLASLYKGVFVPIPKSDVLLREYNITLHKKTPGFVRISFDTSKGTVTVSKRVLISYRPPPVTVMVPDFTPPGSPLSIEIVSRLKNPVLVNVSIGNMSSLHLISKPSNRIDIDVEDLPPGIYTVYVRINQTECYRGFEYFKPVSIGAKEYELAVSGSYMVIRPFQSMALSIRTTLDSSYRAVVRVNGESVAEESFSNRSVLFTLGLPTTWLISIYKVEVTVEPDSASYLPKTIGFNVIVINSVGLVLSVVLVVAVLYSGETEIVGVANRVLVYALRFVGVKPESYTRIVGAGKERRRDRRVFKSSFSLLYYRFVRIVSRITSPPASSETLREFLARFSRMVAGRAVDLARRFIVLYERAIYSRHRVDPEELGKVLKGVEDEI